MKKSEFVQMGQGPATKIEDDSVGKQKDDFGFTQPNLHRRIDPQKPSPNSIEVKEREYNIGVYNLDSYRMTKINYHDEESTTDETP